ncbi:MAG: hypothetical protein D5R96_02715 [Methanocalculus sp. MSAO_Arc2]|uniref:DUF7289 family protein n=1 Tax=Methanocalculus sp. MSAO_Arc2 TaxID=2293855 RepID=UPI000FEFF194|nr:MAG: hypothetical protein D5R96_02715 [Methanocalculus sp. MSAO_Arc2]
MRNDGAVSESIGFILILSIVMIGIAIVVLYGLPFIVTGQGSADMRNMEQTMIILQNDLSTLSYRMAPFKETSLQVLGGTMTVSRHSGEFKISCGEETVYQVMPGKIRYVSDLDRSRVAIENGAVLTRPGSKTGSAVISEPRWYYDDPGKTLIISFVKIHTRDGSDRSLSGVGRVEMKRVSTETIHIDAAGRDVFIRYIPYENEDYSVAWENYMKGRHGMVLCIDGSYRCPDVDRLVIKTTSIQISGF